MHENEKPDADADSGHILTPPPLHQCSDLRVFRVNYVRGKEKRRNKDVGSHLSLGIKLETSRTEGCALTY